MKKGRVTVSDDQVMCDWSAPILGEVVTLSEACILFDRAEGTIKNQCLIGRIAARRSFTGGTWIISLASLISHYGPIAKERDVLCLNRTSLQ